MDRSSVSYLTFGIVLVLAVVFDLGLLSRKGTTVSMKKALLLTLFWVSLAMLFFVFLWLQEGHKTALEYLSAYVMEWSLSVDNIFVFILIFTFFGVKPAYYARVLLIGILVAIFLRIVFIAAGIVLVNEAHWVLYIGGVVLIISGGRLFITLHDEEPDIEKDLVYRSLRKLLPLTKEDGGGKFVIVRDGRKRYTSLFVVVVLLATTDIVFAVDSIPAVFGITQKMVVIFTSNIFAVLGLRSLFFLLRGAVDRFRHLQQGIAVVLIFVGLKMLVEYFNIYLPIYVSLLVILVCIVSSILYSQLTVRKPTS
ncbi:MAG TPA: TerC/Alx family metal homeostasis membrane protein [Puia sp.]|nr:TerC/Alx family metal homeostasis membrane protein [Puia sp.]